MSTKTAMNLVDFNQELATRQEKLKKAKREHKKCHRNVQNLSNRKDKELKRNSRRMAFKRPRVECNGCTTLDATLQIQLDIQYGCYDCKYKQAKKKLAYLNNEEKLAKDNLEQFQANYCPREDSDTSTTTPSESSYDTESSTDNSTESEIKEELIDGPFGNSMKSERRDSIASTSSMPPLVPVDDSFTFYIGEHPNESLIEPTIRIEISDVVSEYEYSSENQSTGGESTELERSTSDNDELEDSVEEPQYPICVYHQNCFNICY